MKAELVNGYQLVVISWELSQLPSAHGAPPPLLTNNR